MKSWSQIKSTEWSYQERGGDKDGQTNIKYDNNNIFMIILMRNPIDDYSTTVL